MIRFMMKKFTMTELLHMKKIFALKGYCEEIEKLLKSRLTNEEYIAIREYMKTEMSKAKNSEWTGGLASPFLLGYILTNTFLLSATCPKSTLQERANTSTPALAALYNSRLKVGSVTKLGEK